MIWKEVWENENQEDFANGKKTVGFQKKKKKAKQQTLREGLKKQKGTEEIKKVTEVRLSYHKEVIR